METDDCSNYVEFAASMIVFLGMIAAIAIAVVAATFFIPSEEEFVQMGCSPVARYHWTALALTVPLGVSILASWVYVRRQFSSVDIVADLKEIKWVDTA